MFGVDDDVDDLFVSSWWGRCLKGSKLSESVQPLSTVALLQTGHGGAAEDGPARLAERHAVRLTDIQVL